MLLSGESIRGVCGIYSIIHRDTGLCYVGSAVNIWTRYTQHMQLAKSGDVSCARLYRLLREHGVDAFDFEVLERCDRSELLAREQFYIALLDSAGSLGMNTQRYPARNGGLSLRGIPLRPEHCAKISAGKKGKPNSGLVAKGVPQSKELIAKRSAALRASPKFKAASDARIGVKMPPGFSEAISARMKGVPKTKEHKAKLSAARLGVSTGRGKQVNQIDAVSGEILAVFKSVSEAAKSLSGTIGCISAAARGDVKTSLGFRWSYQ